MASAISTTPATTIPCAATEPVGGPVLGSTSAGLAQHLLASRGDGLQLTATAAYERVLVGERRFRELRNWRRLQRVGRRPGYRLRPRRLRRGPRQTPIVEAAQ